MEPHFFSNQELLGILDSSLNRSLGDLDVKGVFSRTVEKPKITGIAGDVVEQSILGLPSDSYQRPDLNVEGVLTELKTTGIIVSKKNGKEFEAKEPMSITAVSPKKIVLEEFESSNFWHKLEHMLLVYYHYDSHKTVEASEYAKFILKGYEFHEFNEDDRDRLSQDWKIVRDFIRELQLEHENPEAEYPRISSELRSRLAYIDTAPKWPNRPRFRLKRSLVTSIVQNHFDGKLEQLPGKYTGWIDVDNKCNELVERYSGWTIKELYDYFEIDMHKDEKRRYSKSASEQVIVRMFGGTSKKINKVELFKKFGLIGKSITITKTGKRTEDMKLFPIDFEEWTDKSKGFEESKIYDYFANNQFLFIIFEEPSVEAPLSENKFLGFRRLYFSDTEIANHVRKVWLRVRKLVMENKLAEIQEKNKKGEFIINKNGTIRTSLNFPKSKDGVIFIRGSGKDSNEKILTLNGIQMYSQYVWIRGDYISEKIRE